MSATQPKRDQLPARGELRAGPPRAGGDQTAVGQPRLDGAGKFDFPIIPRLGKVGIPVACDHPGTSPVGETAEEADLGRAGP
eukprot:8125427-Alexandrium_andersonii.AAC.2